jgi:hypothetical protein
MSKFTPYNYEALRDMGLGSHDFEFGNVKLPNGKWRLLVTFFNCKNQTKRFHMPLSCGDSANAMARHLIKHYEAGTLDKIRLEQNT